ncbi:MAG: PQQ-binding-like beta-propeller repeat protein [Gammaproteobacteria bacterium]|nr:PQQ-binding-like beta-propeller repeat protein [Gammaproteobacteria bacterium]
MRWFAAVLAAVVLSGCASLMSDLTDKFPVSSDSVIRLKGDFTQSEVRQQLVEYSGNLYAISNDGVISVFNVGTGQVTAQQRVASVSVGLTQADGLGLFAATNGDLIALSLDDLSVRWRHKTQNFVHTLPTKTSNRVYVLTDSNRLLALEAATGQLAWTAKANTQEIQTLGGARPAAVAGGVLVGMSDGSVTGFSEPSGEFKWQSNVGDASALGLESNVVDIDRELAVVGRRVIAASKANIVAAIDGRTGETIWKLNRAVRAGLIAMGEQVMLVDDANNVIALSSVNGQVLWSQKLGLRVNQMQRSNNSLLLVGQRDIAVLSGTNGQTLLQKSFDAAIRAALITQSADAVYVLTEMGQLIRVPLS